MTDWIFTAKKLRCIIVECTWENIFKSTLKAGEQPVGCKSLVEGMYWLWAGEKTYKVVVAR